eukprot:CAMPEP_0184982750 /NCGR_PEP_ID=MMETSP1098-20130426/12168_1 /TAXON_ID=89044 /ORGANISM="Spumella elongata, Strain CCAP 955/1" /LENGTH=529 /DNA_ID=CAMNT_0027506499 /DNA_START=246 /DNA_END=1835 /DNA_ORIENTATION=-
MSTATASTSLPPSITIFNTAYDRPWTEEETRLLSELVGHQQIVHHKNNSNNTTICYEWNTTNTSSTPPTSDTNTPEDTNHNQTTLITIDACVTNPFKINWVPISMRLGRATSSLIKQYNHMKQITYKHGAFTNTEDVHIIRRYLEWKCVYKENAKSGIWSLLERELNRKDKRISERWRHVLCKRLATLVALDAENNIIDPLQALVIWINQEDVTKTNLSGDGEFHKLGTSVPSSSIKSVNSMSKGPTTSNAYQPSDSLLRKRTYSATDSVLSGNSNDTNHSARKSISEHTSNTYAQTDTNSTNDSAMNDINSILQSIHNEEYTNHSILSLGSSVYDGTAYGGSMWSTIDTNNTNNNNNHSSDQTQSTRHQASNNNANNAMQYEEDVMNDNNAFSSSVWNSIASPSNTKGTKSMSRWTEEQDARLREAVSLFPRDWVKISEFMGISESSSKCRKRWARLRQKYQQTLSTALQDANDFSLLEGEEQETDSDHQALLGSNSNRFNLNFSILEDEEDEDEMELYRDLQDMVKD